MSFQMLFLCVSPVAWQEGTGSLGVEARGLQMAVLGESPQTVEIHKKFPGFCIWVMEGKFL